MRCFYEGVRNVSTCRGPVTRNPSSRFAAHPAFDAAAGCCAAHRDEARTRASAGGDDLRGLREAA